MATKFHEGDRVQVATRDVTAEDTKSQLYYAHFGGLSGTIQKIYTSGEVALELDLASLAPDVAQRHEDMRVQMQNKWLDSLSEEAKTRLTDAERDFKLRYNLLVAQTDLETFDPTAKKHIEEAAPRRLTSEDLAAREAEELAKRLK